MAGAGRDEVPLGIDGLGLQRGKFPRKPKEVNKSIGAAGAAGREKTPLANNVDQAALSDGLVVGERYAGSTMARSWRAREAARRYSSRSRRGVSMRMTARKSRPLARLRER
jgi:hypothetical protein